MPEAPRPLAPALPASLIVRTLTTASMRRATSSGKGKAKESGGHKGKERARAGSLLDFFPRDN